jgi:hypothetical protein
MVAAVAGAEPQSAENSALVTILEIAKLAGNFRSLRLITSKRSEAILEFARNSAMRINNGIINVVTLVD